MITYRHGHVTVLDRRKLKDGSCECYGIVSANFNELLQASSPSSPIDANALRSSTPSITAGNSR